MELSHAKITADNLYEFEFDERYPEKNLRKKTFLSVRKVDMAASSYDSKRVEAKDVQTFIVSQVRDLCIYIADKAHREIFYKIADFIVKAEELPINIKTVNYPGSALILMEYGILGIAEESVKRLELAILNSLGSISYKEELIEEEEEEVPASPPIEEEDFPFGVSNDAFVDNDEFSLGQVEEVEEDKEDDDD